MTGQYRKTVRVQMARIKDGGNTLYSNSDKIDISMRKTGYLVFELYDGDNLIATEEKWLEANFNIQLYGIDLILTN